MEKLLFVCLEAPHYKPDAQIKAFEYNSYEVIPFSWQPYRFSNGIIGMHDAVVETAKKVQPDVIFLQIQHPECLTLHFAKRLAKIAFVVNYTYDVRSKEKTQWMYDIAPHIGLTLFACQEDVNHCYEQGIKNTACIHSSCDMDWYKPIEIPKSIDLVGIKTPTAPIVFIGNNYKHTNLSFELADERFEMVQMLKETYGNDFLCEGMNWQESKIVNPQQEIYKYNTAKIAISHNNYDRENYTSDRIWRIMACGCFCLTKYFKGIEDIFDREIHLDWWHDFDELKSKIDYYLANDNYRKSVAINGSNYVRKYHTWTDRFRTVKAFINHHK